MGKQSKWELDMTSGSIAGTLLKFSLPLLLGNLFQQIYNIADSVIVGQYLGKEALGGVGSVGMISFLFFSLCFGLANGNGVIIANCFGKKDYERLKQVIANSFFIIVMAGIIMSLLAFVYADDILRIMRTPEENFAYAYTYMRITCGLTITVALYNGISAVLRALGDAKTPLIFLIVSAIINVLLDLLFVISLDYGVAGAAYATVISQFISAIGSIIFAVLKNPYFKFKAHHWKMRFDIILEELKIGIPMSIQTALISISCALLQTLINGYGPTVAAAYTATGKVEGIIFQPYSTLGTAVSVFAGQNLGAKKYERIKSAVIRAEVIVLSLSAIFFAAIMFFDKQIIRLFVDDVEVIDVGTKGLKIAGCAYFALGSIYIFRGALNGLKDVTFSVINGALEVGGRVGFALLLMYHFNMEYLGIWYTNIFTWILIATSAIIRFAAYYRRITRLSM